MDYCDWSSDVCSSDLDTATTEIYTVYYTLSLHDALPISNIVAPSTYCMAM